MGEGSESTTATADLTGQPFGRLIVSGPATGPRPAWNCVCDCGTACVATTSELTHGRRSCGCLARELLAKRPRRMGNGGGGWGRAQDEGDDEPLPPPGPRPRFDIAPEPEAVLWCIYASPRDYPDRFVLRRWVLDDGDAIPDPEPTAVVATIEEARAAMPAGRKQLTKGVSGDPVVAEVWQ